jgi:uncharacterized RDD family membrane protein YckC/type II secretory pathway pseudopilin PulG
MSASPAAYSPPVDQPPPQAVASPYGGFWIRFAAHCVDSFILGIGMIVISIAWVLAAGAQSVLTAESVLTLLMFVMSQGYHAYFVSSEKMATPGKRLCGLYVTDEEGHRLGFGRALWRNLAALFSYLTLYLGFFMAGFTARKQALHDKIAGTLVHRQPGGSAAIAIIIVVVAVFVGVAIMGILAAVAIPAYQDYTMRSKIYGVVAAVSAAKAPIQTYASEKGAWPTTWEQVEAVGGTNPMRLLPQNSRPLVEDIRIELGGTVVSYVKIHQVQGQIRLAPRMAGNTVEWTCTASAEIRKFVPAACRE